MKITIKRRSLRSPDFLGTSEPVRRERTPWPLSLLHKTPAGPGGLHGRTEPPPDLESPAAAEPPPWFRQSLRSLEVAASLAEARTAGTDAPERTPTPLYPDRRQS